MTEEEAKTKLCPQTLGAVVLDGHGPVFQSANCVASECMAWRAATRGPTATPGYCGLAGKPSW